jgi:mRNA-degrading endonuclease YafQ of YafQ-DinJ toxin-antitoxin module
MNKAELDRANEISLEKDIKKAQIKAIKAAKMFAELVLSLQEEFDLDQKTLDELLKPRTEELYKKALENDMCLYDLNSSIDLLGVISTLTLGRCKNQTQNLLSELYKLVLGQYEPENEMPISEIVFRLRELQTK